MEVQSEIFDCDGARLKIGDYCVWEDSEKLLGRLLAVRADGYLEFDHFVVHPRCARKA